VSLWQFIFIWLGASLFIGIAKACYWWQFPERHLAHLSRIHVRLDRQIKLATARFDQLKKKGVL
jgi:hypothetical protein